MRSLRGAPPALPLPLMLLALLALLLAAGHGAVITGACERDQQCGGGMCCAVSLWIRSLRMCTPMGNLGDECHPLSHRVPFSGRRMHHTCPCLPGLACLRTPHSRFRCLPDFRKEDVFF
ncbi:prokineticin-2 [Vidua chalybeata]|uniref:prokineticin-2 n=1 Tax=Vidua chalybeata TaxID=81927 RepID=UPI0023A84400|nr:prokineticin-2 [Vidua chalybeata]